MNPKACTTARAFRWTARGFSLLILLFWGGFIVAHLLGDAGRPARPLGVHDAAQIALMLLGLGGLALAWRHEPSGAAITLAATAGAVLLNPRAVTGLGALPLVAALLFLLAWHLSRPYTRRAAA